MEGRKSPRRFDPLPEVIPTPKETALVVIDMQYAFAHPDYGIGKVAKERGRFEVFKYLFATLTPVVANIQRLQKVCRENGIEVMFVNTESYTTDGRDLSPNYKLRGYFYVAGSKDVQTLEEVKPVGGEIVFKKLSTCAFTSTNIDQVLKYMGITKLLATGIRTNYCVETFIRDARDRGYEVVLVEDCCTTLSEEFHRFSCEVIEDVFCKVKTTDQIIKMIKK